MSLKAGRVGVNPKEVDGNGNLKESSNSYSKAESDEKFETKADIGGLQFRVESGTAQYKTPEGDWTNFSNGSSGGIGFNIPNDLLMTDAIPVSSVTILSGGYAIVDGILYIDFTLKDTSSSQSTSKIIIKLPDGVECTNTSTIALYTPAVNSYNAGYVCQYSSPSKEIKIGIYNAGIPANVEYRIYGQFSLNPSV